MNWRKLTRNLGWKVGSLMLSILLWFTIVGEPEVVTTHTVPILYRKLPLDLLIGPDAEDTVRLDLRGPSSKLAPRAVSELAVLVDLAGVSGPGEPTLTLFHTHLNLPSWVAFLPRVPSAPRFGF